MVNLALRRPRAVLAVVGVGVAAAMAVAALTSDRLGAAGFVDPDSPSARALATMREELGFDPEPGMVILARSDEGFRGAGPRRAIRDLAAAAARDPAVGRVETAFGRPPLPFLVSGDGRQTLLVVHFRSSDLDELAEPIDRLRSGLEAPPGIELAYDGYAVGFAELREVARSDLVRAELIALPILALLLLLIFRGAWPAALPLLSGGAAIAATVATLRLLSEALDLSIFAVNLAVLVGLGLAVDYGLLLVARYREEAYARGHGPETVRATLAAAGRTVVYGGCAVAGASAALLVFPQSFIYSMGLAGIIVAVLSVAAALVVTTPLLALLGPRVGTRAPRPVGPPDRTGWWGRWAAWVMRRPVDVAIAGTAILIAAAAPALLLSPTAGDADAVPEGNEVRTVADAIVDDFPPFRGVPVEVAIEARPGGPPPDSWLPVLARAPGVVGLHRLESRSGVAVVQLYTAGSPYAAESQELVDHLRELPAPFLVGGRTAEFVDLKRSIAQRAPVAIAFAAFATFLVVLWMTGSLILPLKALVFNALGICATLGLLVLIFQKDALGIGWLLGYDGPSALEITSCVVIVATTLGLATDYSILLLARITEEHAAGRDDARAVAVGMQRTGPVITSAALLLCVALLALATSQIYIVKQLTVGQALGVAIDATVIRMLLVPAYMCILGRRNWWAPRWLRRIRARLGGAPSHAAARRRDPP